MRCRVTAQSICGKWNFIHWFYVNQVKCVHKCFGGSRSLAACTGVHATHRWRQIETLAPFRNAMLSYALCLHYDSVVTVFYSYSHRHRQLSVVLRCPSTGSGGRYAFSWRCDCIHWTSVRVCIGTGRTASSLLEFADYHRHGRSGKCCNSHPKTKPIIIRRHSRPIDWSNRITNSSFQSVYYEMSTVYCLQYLC